MERPGKQLWVLGENWQQDPQREKWLQAEKLGKLASLCQPQKEYHIIIISPSCPHMRYNKPLQCSTSLPSSHMTRRRKHKYPRHPVFMLTVIQLHECVSVFNIISAFLEPQKEKASIKSRIRTQMPEFRKLFHLPSWLSCNFFQRDWKMTQEKVSWTPESLYQRYIAMVNTWITSKCPAKAQRMDGIL